MGDEARRAHGGAAESGAATPRTPDERIAGAATPRTPDERIAGAATPRTLDERIAGAIQGNVRAVALAIIEGHDAEFPGSKLRTIPLEERIHWVEQSVEYVWLSIERNQTVTWSYSYCPNVMGGFDPLSPPYVEVASLYETMLQMEDCMLPFVWAAFEDDPQDLLPAVRRFRYHMMRFIDANVEKLQDDLARRLRGSLAAEAVRARDEVLSDMCGYLDDACASLDEKLAVVYDAVANGEDGRALALLTATKLHVGDISEHGRALRGRGAKGPEAYDSRRGQVDGLDPCAFLTPSHVAQGTEFAGGWEADREVRGQCPPTPLPRGGACGAIDGGAIPEDPGVDQCPPSPSTHGAPAFSGAASVTPREAEVLQGVVAGKTNPEIAVELALSIGTVRNYISALLVKLDAENRTQLAIAAVRLGLA